MDNDISWAKEVSLQRPPLSLTAHDGNGPRSAPLAEVWGISRCRRNRAEIVEGKERQMKRDSNPTTKCLTVQKRRAGRALGGI